MCLTRFESTSFDLIEFVVFYSIISNIFSVDFELNTYHQNIQQRNTENFQIFINSHRLYTLVICYRMKKKKGRYILVLLTTNAFVWGVFSVTTKSIQGITHEFLSFSRFFILKKISEITGWGFTFIQTHTSCAFQTPKAELLS